MARVFFSYSHADEALRDRLEQALTVMVRQGLVDSFHDRRIPAGDVLDVSISAELDRADVILLLVSPDFLASSYCFDREMARAMERHRADEARVIPIILRPCDWKNTELATLLALPPDAKPVTRFPDLDEAFLAISQGIRQALQASEPLPPRSPVAQAAPAASDTVRSALPRSSNLRIKKVFTDRDRDRFKDEAFAFIVAFFENSVVELQARNPGVEGTVQRIDARSFTATLYRDGHRRAFCRVFKGPSHMARGIAYSSNEHAAGESFNESLSVEANDDGLFLKPLGMAVHGRNQSHLTPEGAAELYWGLFIDTVR